MDNYIKALILLAVVGNIFILPLNIALRAFLDVPISNYRQFDLIVIYSLFLIAVATILWIAKKRIPDGKTKSGRNAYRRTGAVLFVIFGASALYAKTSGVEGSATEVAKNLSIALSMPIGAAFLEWFSPKLHASADEKKAQS